MPTPPWQAATQPVDAGPAQAQHRGRMARGFESKNVEWQQQRAQDEKAARARPKTMMSAEERARLERRRSLELALARARADLEKATQPAHRELLLRTASALEKELETLA